MNIDVDDVLTRLAKDARFASIVATIRAWRDDGAEVEEREALLGEALVRAYAPVGGLPLSPQARESLVSIVRFFFDHEAELIQRCTLRPRGKDDVAVLYIGMSTGDAYVTFE